MSVKHAQTHPPDAFAPIRRAFLGDTLEINFSRLGLDGEFLLLSVCTLLIQGKSYWQGVLAVDRFDPRLLGPAEGEAHAASVTRHILSCAPFCLSLADQSRNPDFVLAVTNVLTKALGASVGFAPARADQYVTASPAALVALPPREFCVYCSYTYLPDQPFVTRHRITIVSRLSAPHRLVYHLAVPSVVMAAREAWPECGGFALAELATDQLETLQSEGVLPRRWRIALWESLHGTTRPERLFDAVLTERRFVVMPAEGDSLRVATLTPETVNQIGDSLIFRIGNFPSDEKDANWDQAVFNARFADAAAAKQALDLILGAVEPRIDRLEGLPIKGCAYAYYLGADHAQAGVTCRGQTHDCLHFWDGLYTERGGRTDPALGDWRQFFWRKRRTKEAQKI